MKSTVCIFCSGLILLTISPIFCQDTMQVLADEGIEKTSFNARKDAVLKRWNELRPEFSGGNIYDRVPSYSGIFSQGKVSDTALSDGINMLNFYRFLVGLPDDVELTSEYNELAQYGSVLNAAWGRIAHQQSQPNGMSAEFYQKASQGIGSSNLHKGQGSVSEAIKGWMEDSDAGNIDRLGHRRWILNPGMLYTGLSYVDGFSALYSFDSSRSKKVDYQAIAFPSGAAFPNDFFGNEWAWNVSINPDTYQSPSKNNIRVLLTESSTGKKWSFGAGNNDGYFNIETSRFGVPNCIIFRPQGITKYNGTYQVHIEGIRTSTGTNVVLQYETTFFDMEIEAGPGDFQYEIQSNTIRITKYSGSMKNVIIPARINTMPVAAIGKGAFAHADITGITLPNTITTIEEKAFWYSNITSLVIPPSVLSIGKQAFYSCKYLSSITLPARALSIDSFAFSECVNLETVIIPTEITKLGYGAFSKCLKLNNNMKTKILNRFGNSVL
ncbi:hypothetical protein FACS1894137_06460 [Spirochaetia bacterium]|nr:hypothetical protein FACS1894137_06460 [Spirochaetia bacterium]